MGLKIQVNGKGMIPRGYGLAPRKEPFNANDFSLIGLILNTPGLSIKYLNPERNVLLDLTKKNAKTVWDKYASYVAPAQSPEVTEQPKEVKKENVKLPEAGDVEAKKESIKVVLDDKPGEVVPEKVDEMVDDSNDECAESAKEEESTSTEEKTTEQVVPASQQAVITPAQSPKQNKGGNGNNKNAKH